MLASRIVVATILGLVSTASSLWPQNWYQQVFRMKADIPSNGPATVKPLDPYL